MFTKLALVAAILLGTASATYAGPNDRVPEPIYFTLATGHD